VDKLRAPLQERGSGLHRWRLYSIGRFAIEALRLDSFWLGPFRVPQLASLVGVAVAIVGLAWSRRRDAALI